MKKSLLIVLLIFFSCGDNPDNEGRIYDSLNQLINIQKKMGFVQIGRFGQTWPAEIVEVKTSIDEIEFVFQNDQKHTYKGFLGYELKIIRLKSNGGGRL